MRVDGAALEPDRAAGGVRARPDLRERVERVDVVREGGERKPVLLLGLVDPSSAPVELPELHARPGLRLGLSAGRVDGGRHRHERGARVAEKLARVRDAGVRSEAGVELGHAVEGGECRRRTGRARPARRR